MTSFNNTPPVSRYWSFSQANYFMLSRGEHYRDSAADYEVLSFQRNASRWIRKLRIRFHSESSLIRYAQTGNLPIDNSPLENAIRPIAIGKRIGCWQEANVPESGRLLLIYGGAD